MIAQLLLLTALVNPLDRILDDPALHGAIVSASVTTLDGKPLYQRNAKLRVMPASNQKILTTLYALHTLGPTHRSQTRFWKLDDRVVIDAPGDPTITTAQLQSLRERLGLGPVVPVYVRQAYSPGVPPSWEFDDLPHRYAPRITALTVDRGGFVVRAQDAELVPIPDAYGVQPRHIPSNAKPKVEFDWTTGQLVVRGKLPQELTDLDTLSLPAPDQTAARLLGGPMLVASRVPEADPDLVHQSPTLIEVVGQCLKPSDNLYAENLLLMAASRGGALDESPYDIAQKRFATFLTQVVRLDSGGIRPFDGSGMSRHNFVTTDAMTSMLAWAQVQPWAPAFKEALARPGESGTLKTRLVGSAFWGKTGTLDAVVALSGYLRTSDGKELIVSLIFNHGTSPAASQRAVADRFVQELSRRGVSGMKRA